MRSRAMVVAESGGGKADWPGPRCGDILGGVNSQPTIRNLLMVAGLSCVLLTAPSLAGGQPLAGLSLEQLMDLEVVSASRNQEPLFDTAAAIAVLTRADIERSGATTIPDVLRLVPGLQVARLDANKWAVSARGFNGRFASRLLVLVDGRSVYTTMFSGVHWEQQDLLLDNIERIEIVRGPGAVVWGANAVNGVINIVTRQAASVSGPTASAWVGTQGRGAALSSALGLPGEGRMSWFVKATGHDDMPDSSGSDVGDAWRMGRMGLRADWQVGDSDLSVISEVFVGDLGQTFRIPANTPPYLRAMPDDSRRQGGHVHGRWSRQVSETEALTLQLYHDRFSVRDILVDGSLSTWDADFQHSRRAGAHDLVWGLGYRLSRDEQEGSPTFQLSPSQRNLRLASAFVQDDLALADRWHLKVGARLEHHTYTGLEVQPNMRLRWSPTATSVVWGSLSRAVRTPSRAEREGRLLLSPLAPDSLFAGAPPVQPVVVGTKSFNAEVLRAAEGGWRLRLRDNLLLDAAVFYNDYRGIVGTQLRLPVSDGTLLTAELPVINAADVRTHGSEIAFDWHKGGDRARVRGSWTFLKIDTKARPNTAHRQGRGEGDNPEHQLTLWASIDPLPSWQADVMIRRVGELPALSVDGYVGIDARLAYRLTKDLDIAISGRNLLDDNRLEFQNILLNTVPAGSDRSLHTQLTWRP